MSRYVVTVEEDLETGDLILPIPDELLTEVGWNIGDVLVWEDTEIWESHGEYPGYTLRKKFNNEELDS